MPRTRADDLPSTVRRSPQHAQEIFSATLRSATEEYGDGERARRTAYAALKHSFEKVGDHWEAKRDRGPSDDAAAGLRDAPTHEGVDARASKSHLLDLARRLEIRGRSTMTKEQLVDALQRENRRRSARSRSTG